MAILQQSVFLLCFINNYNIAAGVNKCVNILDKNVNTPENARII